jgi:hypothetical protein
MKINIAIPIARLKADFPQCAPFTEAFIMSLVARQRNISATKKTDFQS